MPFSVTLKIHYILLESSCLVSFVECVRYSSVFIKCYFKKDNYFPENSLPNFYQQASVKAILNWLMKA